MGDEAGHWKEAIPHPVRKPVHSLAQSGGSGACLYRVVQRPSRCPISCDSTLLKKTRLGTEGRHECLGRIRQESIAGAGKQRDFRERPRASEQLQ
jgi:hypothetical protein